MRCFFLTCGPFGIVFFGGVHVPFLVRWMAGVAYPIDLEFSVSDFRRISFCFSTI